MLFSFDFGDILITLKFDITICTYFNMSKKKVETSALHFNEKSVVHQTHSHKKSCNLIS